MHGIHRRLGTEQMRSAASPAACGQIAAERALAPDRLLRAMAQPVVSMDESGNSGQNLLDEVQPIFTLASVSLPTAAAQQLIYDTGGPGAAGELKFSDLRVEPNGREQIIRILESDVLTPETSRVLVCHKPYMVTAKMVDILVEPAFYARGMNFYEDDGALRWPTSMHELSAEKLGQDLWDGMRREFIAHIRRPRSHPPDRFIALVGQALDRTDDPRLELLLTAMLEQAPAQLRASEGVSDPLDPALPGLIEQLHAWGHRFDAFEVDHDHAAVIERNVDAIMRLTEPDAEPPTTPSGDPLIQYPLKVTAIRTVDSRDSPGVQLADIVAGASRLQQAAYVGGSPADPFVLELEEAGIRRFMDHFVAPGEFVRRSMDLSADGADA